MPCVIDSDVHCVHVQVQKSPVFRRDGADVHSDLFVSVAQAVLGGTARTQGLYETLNLSVSRHVHSQVSPLMRKHFRPLVCDIEVVFVVFRSLQASRQTRGFVCQERESLVSVATASETIMCMSK